MVNSKLEIIELGQSGISSKYEMVNESYLFISSQYDCISCIYDYRILSDKMDWMVRMDGLIHQYPYYSLLIPCNGYNSTIEIKDVTDSKCLYIYYLNNNNNNNILCFN